MMPRPSRHASYSTVHSGTFRKFVKDSNDLVNILPSNSVSRINARSIHTAVLARRPRVILACEDAEPFSAAYKERENGANIGQIRLYREACDATHCTSRRVMSTPFPTAKVAYMAFLTFFGAIPTDRVRNLIS